MAVGRKGPHEGQTARLMRAKKHMVAFHNKQDCANYCRTIAKTAKIKRNELELLDKAALIWLMSHPECIED